MGNTLLDDNKKQDPKQMYEQWLQQNPDLVGRKVLTHNKLFETNFFKYCEFSIKMEVFFRRDNTPIQDYLKAFQVIQALVERYKCTHILPMRIVEMKEFKDKEYQKYSQNFAVGMRQYLHMTLEQRLETRPCLTEQQKFWIIYQIIFSMYTIHDVFNIYHGNVRSSNFLLTTYNYLILSDFASYKPTYILQDTEQGLSEFRLFYSSSVQKCNLPPEKLVARDVLVPEALSSKNLFNIFNNGESEKEKGEPVKKIKKNYVGQDSEAGKQLNALKMMDMFSVGLTILNVLNDGRSYMSYSDLLRMKKQGLNLTSQIAQAVSKLQRGKAILGELLKDLLKQKPEQRPTATSSLQRISQLVQHQFYLLLWMCLSVFNKSSFSSCDLRVNLIYSLIDFIENRVRESEYKWANKPPRCLSGFKALKIFVELIDKNGIFSPKIEGNSTIFSKLFKYIQQVDEVPEPQYFQEEIIVQQVDERRNFFINPSKKNKIAKRLSIASDYRPRSRQLCPPSFKQIETLIQNRHVPIKLTHIGLRSSRQEQLLREYKINQHVREDRLKQPKYYKSCDIMIKIIFACIRGCKYVASKLLALQTMNLLSRDCSDQYRLHVVLPYLMHLSQDSDISVAREALLSLISLFYCFVDPFNSEQDIYYYEIIIEYLVGIIKQPKLRSTLFAHFKQVFGILEWLEIHYKRFNRTLKITLSRLLQVLKIQYGYYSRQEVKLLLDGNIPQHFLPDMFEFYISLINTDRLQGLRLSLSLARNVNPLTHRHILEAFDSCIEGGLDDYGIGLFYSIQYFTLRKNTSHFIVRKIAPHVLNPSKWVRDEAVNYVRMCVNEYPPTKNYFFFKDIFEAPFPLKPEDIQQQFLLPDALKQSDIDWKERKVKNVPASPTMTLFYEYLTITKLIKQKRRGDEEIERWDEAYRAVQQEGKLLNFQTYTKKQLQLLYEYNLLYYVLNMNNRYVVPEKDKLIDKNYQLAMAFKKMGRNIDLTSIDHQKKELFEQFEGSINSSFERLLAKKNRDYGEPVSEKIKLAQAIITIGEVLCKFQMFKIKPIPKLGTYIRQPTTFQKLARPRGILISQVFEHTDSVTCLQKVADQFIISGSADGTLRVFDAKKIQTNITTCSEGSLQLRGEGQEKVKISSIAAFDQTYAVVVGSNRGQIRVYPIERLGKAQSQGKNDEIAKYFVGGELEKIVTLANELKNQCFCYVTAEGNLGVQDIRLKSRAMSCSIGRERGIPRALCATSRQCILVGTVDGYVVNFDIRFNVISNVLQLQTDRQSLPVTNIVNVPFMNEQQEQLFALTYPSRNYEFSCFNLQENKHQFGPERQYTSSSPEEIVNAPFLVNRTSDEQFKLCRNSLTWRKAYDQLSDFSKNFNIFDYLSDPLTRKEAKIREIWLDNSKNRYNQISSLYHRRQLPFVEWLHSGVLTTLNPLPGSSLAVNAAPFALLTDRKEAPLRDPLDIQRPLSVRPNNSHRVFGFAGEEGRQWASCCRVLPNLVVLAGRNNQLKIYM